MSSSALSVADFIARWRAASSEAAAPEQAGADAGGDVLRQQRVEHLRGARLELVERQQVVGVRRLASSLDDLERQQPDDLGLLGDHRDEPGVDDVDLVDAALLVGLEEVRRRAARRSPWRSRSVGCSEKPLHSAALSRWRNL